MFSEPQHSQEETYQDLAEINIIPLVDIMLVLLIIFMVAAPLSINGIGVNLPSSAVRGGNIEAAKVVLSISDRGDYFLDKLAIPKNDLGPRLKAIFKGSEAKDLYIRADKKVAYGAVIDAMSAAKLAGVRKVSMLTVPPVKGS